MVTDTIREKTGFYDVVPAECCKTHTYLENGNFGIFFDK